MDNECSTRKYSTPRNKGASSRQPRTEGRPFVRRFATEECNYVYDVNTCHIVRVSPVVWDVLEDIGDVERAGILRRHGERWGSDQVDDAIDQIRHAQESLGLFLPNEFSEMRMPWGKDEIAARLQQHNAQLILNVTESCTLRCPYCTFGGWYTHHRSHSNRMMTWGVAKAAIDNMLGRRRSPKDDEQANVTFFGGEPLLNFGLIQETVRYVREVLQRDDVFFALTTNGTLLKDKVADFLVEHGFSVLVSCHAPPALHDRDRPFPGGRGSWRIVRSNLEALFERHPEYSKVSVNTVLVPPVNVAEIEKWWASDELTRSFNHMSVQELDRNDLESSEALRVVDDVAGTQSLYHRFVANLERGVVSRTSRNCPELFVQTAFFLTSFSRFYNRGIATKGQPRLPQTFYPCRTCIPGDRRLLVTAEGDYFPCERCDLLSDSLKIGNVRDGLDVQKIFSLLADFADLASDECLSCWCSTFCADVCVASVQEHGQLSKVRMKQACEKHRRNTEQIMTDMSAILEKNPEALQWMASH